MPALFCLLQKAVRAYAAAVTSLAASTHTPASPPARSPACIHHARPKRKSRMYRLFCFLTHAVLNVLAMPSNTTPPW